MEVYGPRVVTPPGDEDPNCKVYADLRARHETVNRRFKQFAVLFKPLPPRKIFTFFLLHAIANVTQLIMDTHPLFFVDY